MSHQTYNFKLDHSRVNLFAFPHKAFRFMWLEAVQAIGNGDYTTVEGIQSTSEILKFAITAYTAHNHHESDFFAPHLKIKGGDAEKVYNDWINEHDEHVSDMNNLITILNNIANEKDMLKRKMLNSDLYERAALFLAEDLLHMRWEENVVMGAFQAHYTDAELRAIEQNFLSKHINPEEMAKLTPLFLRAGNIDDRILTLTAIKMSAPPAALDAVLTGLAPKMVPAPELEVIKRRLSAVTAVHRSA